jgi:hypothetical protein
MINAINQNVGPVKNKNHFTDLIWFLIRVRQVIQPQRTGRVSHNLCSGHQNGRHLINYLIMYEVKITPLKMHDFRATGKGESSERWLLNQNSAQLWQNRRLDRVYVEIKRPTRCNRWFFIAKLIVCSTCFGNHYTIILLSSWWCA